MTYSIVLFKIAKTVAVEQHKVNACRRGFLDSETAPESLNCVHVEMVNGTPEDL